jgi:hypothetical protein
MTHSLECQPRGHTAQTHSTALRPRANPIGRFCDTLATAACSLTHPSPIRTEASGSSITQTKPLTRLSARTAAEAKLATPGSLSAWRPEHGGGTRWAFVRSSTLDLAGVQGNDKSCCPAAAEAAFTELEPGCVGIVRHQCARLTNKSSRADTCFFRQQQKKLGLHGRTAGHQQRLCLLVEFMGCSKEAWQHAEQTQNVTASPRQSGSKLSSAKRSALHTAQQGTLDRKPRPVNSGESRPGSAPPGQPIFGEQIEISLRPCTGHNCKLNGCNCQC